MILVTGGTGFLGAILIDQLLAGGQQVRATKREFSKIPDQLVGREGLEWAEADICNFFAVEEALRDVQEVYHCAAKVSYQPKDRKSLLKTNVEGTANLVNLCLEHKIRLVHVSSIAALGQSKNGGLTNENDHWEFDRNQSVYSISKYESEMEVWRGVTEGLDAVIVNPSLIIGATCGNSGSGAVFYTLAKGLKFYTGGTVGVVDVADVAKAMISLMNDRRISGERFIINNENLSHRELLGRISKLLGVPAPSVLAKPWMLKSAQIVSGILSKIQGKKALLTKESVRAALQELKYSNEKLTLAIGSDFKPLDQTLQEIAKSIRA